MKKKSILIILLFALFFVSACASTTQDESTNEYSYHISTEERDERLSHAKLSILLGGIDELQIPNLYPNATILTYSSNADKLFALASNKVDYAICSSAQGIIYSKNNHNEYEYCDEPLYTMGNAFALNKSSTDLQQKISSCIQTLKADGTLASMEQKWVIDASYTMDDVPVITDTSAPVLRVATDCASEPFTFISNEKPAGYDVEVISRVAYMLGMRIEFQQMSFSSTIVSVISGKSDVALNVTPTEEREKEVLFSDIYYEVKIVALSKKQGAHASYFNDIRDSFNSTFIKENRWKLFIKGIEITFLISVFSFALATLVGGLLCWMQISKNKLANKIANFYVKIATGIPILVWLMILYYIVFKSVDISSIIVAIITFGLQTGASLSSIFKTGIDSIDVGQKEAAEALGFNTFTIYKKIIIPQAVLRIFDLYKGEFVSLVKSTSIVGYIAINDLTKVSDIVRSRTYEAFFPLIATAIIYFALAHLVIVILNIVQKKINPKQRKHILEDIKTHA